MMSYIWHHGGKMCGMDGMRHFLTNEEKIELLKERKEWLEMEARGVDEVIKDLEKRARAK